MYIYDEAHKLARTLSECDEYKAYKQAKDRAYADGQTKNLLNDYKKMQFEAQAAYLSGKEPDSELLEKAKKLGEVLAFNPAVGEFLAAEYKMNTILGDIYKIIGDAVDMSPDFLKE